MIFKTSQRFSCGQRDDVPSLSGCSASLLAETQHKALLYVGQISFGSDTGQDEKPGCVRRYGMIWEWEEYPTVLGLASRSGLHEYVSWKLLSFSKGNANRDQSALRNIQEVLLLSALVGLTVTGSYTRPFGKTGCLIHSSTNQDTANNFPGWGIDRFSPKLANFSRFEDVAQKNTMYEIGMRRGESLRSPPPRVWIWLAIILQIIRRLVGMECSPEFWSFV